MCALRLHKSVNLEVCTSGVEFETVIQYVVLRELCKVILRIGIADELWIRRYVCFCGLHKNVSLVSTASLVCECGNSSRLLIHSLRSLPL